MCADKDPNSQTPIFLKKDKPSDWGSQSGPQKYCPGPAVGITCCVCRPPAGWFGQECPRLLCHPALYTLRRQPQEVALIHCNWFIAQHLAVQKGQGKRSRISSSYLLACFHYFPFITTTMTLAIEKSKHISRYSSWRLLSWSIFTSTHHLGVDRMDQHLSVTALQSGMTSTML